MAVHALSHPGFARFGDQTRIIILGDKVVEIMVGLKDDIAATTAIAAAGPAFRAKRFPQERHAAFPTMARAREDFNLIDEHRNRKSYPPNKKGEASDLAEKPVGRA